MKLVKSACALLVFFSSVPGYATTITFATRPAFNAAAPGLPIETFESGLVAPGATVTTCTGPLSSAAGSACFAAARRNLQCFTAEPRGFRSRGSGRNRCGVPTSTRQR